MLKKESIFKRMFASKKVCCLVSIREVNVNKDKASNEGYTPKGDSPCCSSKTE